MHFLWKVIHLTASESVQDNIFKLSAALAYYGIFSLVPMLLVIFWISGMFYESAYVKDQFYAMVREFVGNAAVTQIDSVLENMRIEKSSYWMRVLGVATLIFTSTGIFGEIQNSINHIWGLKVNPKKGIAKIFMSRLISFITIITLGLLLVVSLLANAVLAILLKKIRFYFPDIPLEFYYAVNQVVLFGIIFVLFLAIFKLLPDARMKVRDIAWSAFFTAVLFFIGKMVIGYVLASNVTVDAYGSASSVIIILLWFYYSAIILYIGAEFAQAYLKVKGKHIRPNKFAMWVEEKYVVVRWNTDVVKEDVPEKEPT